MKKLSFIIVILFSVVFSSNLNAKVVKELAHYTECVIFKVGATVTIYHFDRPSLQYYPYYERKIVIDKLKNPKRTTLIDMENEVPEEAVEMIVGHKDGYYDSYEKENLKLREEIYKLENSKNEETIEVEDVPAKTVTNNSAMLVLIISFVCFFFLVLGFFGGIYFNKNKPKQKKENQL